VFSLNYSPVNILAILAAERRAAALAAAGQYLVPEWHSAAKSPHATNDCGYTRKY